MDEDGRRVRVEGDSRGLGGLDAQAVALVSAALSRRRRGAPPPPLPTLAQRGTEEGGGGGNIFRQNF